MSRSFRSLLPVAPIGVAVFLAFVATQHHAVAEDSAADVAEKSEKCATRLFSAMVGESATPEVLGTTTPQAAFDVLVKDPRFVERFSRFINAQFNTQPGANPSEDAAYYLTRYVLQNAKPWSEMFVGKYDVAPSQPNNMGSEAAVTENADGLGYFRSRAWAVRYAGNELAGIRIVTAYRMMQNTIGLQLSAVTNAPDVDITQDGRKAAQCAGCHYTPWFALDNVATVLGTRKGNGNNVTFDPPAGGPKQILGGVSVSNDRELVEAMVANEAFDVNACRLAFKYLYGRTETSCEGPAFDACVESFKKDKLITSALASVAKDAGFCE